MARRTGRPSYLQPRPAARQRRTLLVGGIVAALIASLLGAGVGYLVGRPDATSAAVADLRAAELARDVTQIGELTELARRTRDQITPVLAGLQAAVAASQVVPAERVTAWQQTMKQATDAFADPPSGTTATNVARGGLRSAVTALAVAVDSYAAASGVASAQRAPLMTLIERQVDAATAVWSVAATQLDQINIDAGYGHQHVHLKVAGGEGSFTPDGSAEGAGVPDAPGN
jgi:hypothetical protein